MNTIRVISSISWNTVSFFEEKIRSLSTPGKGQLVDWAHWIWHEPDTDQGKAHIHFVLKPSRRIDTNWLRQQFVEPSDAFVAAKYARGETITIEDAKPLGVAPFRQTSSISDWLRYSVHDEAYLLRKGQTRTFHYKFEDLHTTSQELLNEQWLDSEDPLVHLTQRVIDLYTVEHKSLSEIMQLGLIVPNMLYYFKTLLENLDTPSPKRRDKWNEVQI